MRINIITYKIGCLIKYLKSGNSAYIVCGLSILFLVSCKKLVDVSPPITQPDGSLVFANDATAIAVLTGIYGKMSSAGPTNSSSILGSIYLGLSSDELTLFSGSTNTTYIRYFKNSLSTSSLLTTDYWNNLYPVIFSANSAIEGLSSSTTLTPAIKSQLLGEAKFIRGFCYFYLVNLYNDVPLVIGTDYTVNAVLNRTSQKQVWLQILNDLTDARDLLSSIYLNDDGITVTTERVRPTKWAAAALLARAYLYNSDWKSAEIQSTMVINNSSLYNLAPLDNVFLKNSIEAIWQLQPVNGGSNTEDAKVFVLTGAPNSARPVYLSSFQMNSFEPGDNRKLKWIGSKTVGSITYYFPYKYKINTLNAPVTEYEMILRLAEQYLIRAEARAQLNNISGSVADLNMLRTRARGSLLTDLPNLLSTITQGQALNAVLHERQTELFTELGQRWLDLKRTGAVDSVMKLVTPIKGGTWDINWQWYPIPLNELTRDPNLQQNKGY